MVRNRTSELAIHQYKPNHIGGTHEQTPIPQECIHREAKGARNRTTDLVGTVPCADRHPVGDRIVGSTLRLGRRLHP